MIHWLTQSVHSNKDLAAGLIPHNFLASAETAFYNQLKSDKRRSDWLLGRWTAKHLIQSVLGEDLLLDQIEILSDDDGAPTLNIRYSSNTQHATRNTQYLTPTISISHSHGLALCALVKQPGVPLGADMERVEPRSEAFLVDFFVREEIALVNTVPAQVRSQMATAIWSAKEAALKAIRLGFTVEPFTVKCLPQGDGKDNWSPVLIEWDASQLTVPALEGWWRGMGSYVLTLVATAGENYWPVTHV